MADLTTRNVNFSIKQYGMVQGHICIVGTQVCKGTYAIPAMA